MSRRFIRRLCRHVILLFLSAAGMVFLLQLWAHRVPSFFPDYSRIDLHPILEQDVLSAEDYTLLLEQTGLARPAADTLRTAAPEAILSRQDAFFTSRRIVCISLFPPFIREDRMADPDTGETLYGPLPLALRDGDLLLTLDTHALGWRHGHAGIVADAEKGLVLEAVGVGTSAILRPVEHWREYRSYLVFRPKDPALGPSAAEYARENLLGKPYTLFSGLWGEKFPALEQSLGAHCAYLVWYAYMAQGTDLDSDGGRLVTVTDLSRSPTLELVELYGTDPRPWA